MGRKKAVVVLPHLVDAGGDIEKAWYVEYSMRDPYTNEMKRFRDYAGFKKMNTAEERYEKARQVIEELKDKLAKGWTPFRETKTTYDDLLLMNSVAKRWGTEREGTVTIRVYLSNFLELKSACVSAKSMQTYVSKLRIFCEWAEHRGIDQLHVSCFTPAHITDFLQEIATSKELSRLTMQKYAQILHSFFDYLIDKGCMKNNPVGNIPHLGKVVDQAARPIKDDDRKLLMAAMRKYDRQLWIVCQLQYYCAIRPGECRLLKVGDIDFDGEAIHVPKDVSKNREAESVAMPRQMVQRLKKEGYDRFNKELYLFSAAGTPGERPVGKNTFRNRFNLLRDKLHLPEEYKLYSFKYTGGVALVNAGIDTWELQRHFRHKSIDTTEHYVKKNFAVKSDKIKNHFPDV